MARKYKVYWNTRPGVGSTYYRGEEIVYAGSEEGARKTAQHRVWTRAFKGTHSQDHIVIRHVELML